MRLPKFPPNENELMERIADIAELFGLNVRCPICGVTLPKQFIVPDEEWRSIVPKELQGEWICFPCYQIMAKRKGIYRTEKDVHWIEPGKPETWLGLKKSTTPPLRMSLYRKELR